MRERLPDLATHDFDEVGVPQGADTAWRHRANEEWVRRALDYQLRGIDLLLAAQTPFGELLATPSASHLDAIAACLIDCDDETRIARLRARGADWFVRTGGDVRDYLCWADWMRNHARDPTWRPEVIRIAATEGEMRWARWSDWLEGDPRWRIRTVDTSVLPIEQVANEVAVWVTEERSLPRAKNRALSP